jgi:hypothetical protein
MKKPDEAGIAIEIQRCILDSRCSGKPETGRGFKVLDIMSGLRERLQATYANTQVRVPLLNELEVNRKWPS